MKNRDPAPYYVKPLPVWGGGFHYAIAGEPQRGSRPHVEPLRSEAAARKLCDRMNADYQRYLAAMLARPGDRR